MTIKIPKKPKHQGAPAIGEPAVARQMQPGERDMILTLAQAAEKIDYSVVTLRRWIKSGVLVAYRARGKGAYRILQTDLLKVLIVNDNF